MNITANTAAAALQEIRENAKDNKSKGTAFEILTRSLLENLPEYGFLKVYTYSEWPEREQELELEGIDVGIDLVGVRHDGSYCAIQCKCYDPEHKVSYGDISTFLVESSKDPFKSRILVATSPWNNNAEKALDKQKVFVQRIDFDSNLGHIEIDWKGTHPSVHAETRTLYPLQQKAVDAASEHYREHDRGNMQMACGTGKTFVSLKITEKILPELELSNAVLFCAPSLALVSQAHKEWLRFRDPEHNMRTLIVCSDKTSGRAGANDIKPMELASPPTTNPERLAEALDDDIPEDSMIAVFCTYQSLPVIQEAQEKHGFPKFGLVIADEAHRTTGSVVRDKKGMEEYEKFQLIHDENKIISEKRLYMTATPRVYNAGTKEYFQKQSDRSEKEMFLLDMNDDEIYGHRFYRLTFPEAVDNDMLSDFKVIVLCMDENDARIKQMGHLIQDGHDRWEPTDNGRVLGSLMSVTGFAIDETADSSPKAMKRVVSFANTIHRSRRFCDTIQGGEIHKGFQDLKGHSVEAVHVDGTDTSLQRNRKFRRLREPEADTHILSNAKLLTEGIDVPALDAVVFFDGRQSQVDVVQAVGRVMRKAPKKNFGYVVIPVVIPMDMENPDGYFEVDHGGFKVVWQVLSAMRSHDSRFLDEIESDLMIWSEGGEPTGKSRLQIINASYEANKAQPPELGLQVRKFTRQVYAKVLKQVGTQTYQASTAGQMDACIQQCSRLLKRHNLGDFLVPILGTEKDESNQNDRTVKIACLMLLNACLMQARLEEHMTDLNTLERIRNSKKVAENLSEAWKTILKQDFRPVYDQALEILKALDEHATNEEAQHDVMRALKQLMICAQENAEGIAKLGFDHAGPLYHRLLPGAESDGAFYTNNVSAVLLAGLTLDDDFCDWKDREAISNLKVIDPAMGTGTLLMAAARQIKRKHANAMDDSELEQDAKLHQSLVEKVICGLDINPHGVQMGALNLTLGAPTVDYKKMNLYVMPHGPQRDGTMRAGSLELLDDKYSVQNDLFRFADGKLGDQDLSDIGGRQVDSDESKVRRNLSDIGGRQVDSDESKSDEKPADLGVYDLVIMNPPFTKTQTKGTKFTTEVKKAMQNREYQIAESIENIDRFKGIIDKNNIGRYFMPLADSIIHEKGSVALVGPTTMCIGESSLSQRKYLAKNYQIETIVTSHDPNDTSFSENSAIHTSLFVLRRSQNGTKEPTNFISLRKMPKSMNEVQELLHSLKSSRNSFPTGHKKSDSFITWGTQTKFLAQHVREGNWGPAQWYQPEIQSVLTKIAELPNLIQIGNRYEVGPVGRRISDAFESCNETEAEIYEYRTTSAKVRDQMFSLKPEHPVKMQESKQSRAELYLSQRDNLLICWALNTNSSSIVSIYSEKKAFGVGWTPIRGADRKTDKALCVYLNSTVSLYQLLNRRSRTLTWPNYPPFLTRTILIPNPDKTDLTPLLEAFEKTKNAKLRRFRDIPTDPARKIIDKAVAKVIGIPEDEIAYWGELLSKEPTITNKVAE